MEELLLFFGQRSGEGITPPPAGPPVFRSSSTGGADGDTVVLDVPAGVQVGDLLLLCITGGLADTVTIQTPSNFTEIDVQFSNGGTLEMKCFYKIREMGDGNTITCQTSGFGIDNTLAICLAYEAGTFNAVDPVDSGPSSDGDLSGLTAIAPSIGVTQDNCMLVMFGITNNLDSLSTPSGMSVVATDFSDSLIAFEEEVNTGATGTRTSNHVNDQPWLVEMLAIAPA